MKAWNLWYKNKGYKVEPEIPLLERFLNKDTSSKVLDIGCGHGRHIIYFARKGYKTYGIDSYKPIIKKLRNNLRKYNLSAKLRIKDITKGLPYSKNNFDLIIATRSIHHTTTKSVRFIFKEINRVLKHGGILFLQVPDHDGSEKYEKSRIEYGKPINHKWTELHTYVPLSGPEKGVPHHAFDEGELKRFLKNYKILKIHVGKSHYHGYCLIAKKK